MLRKTVFAGIFAIVLSVAIAIVRTITIDDEASSASQAASSAGDGKAIAERLSGAIRIETVSWGDGRDFDPAPFETLADYLKASYPAAHAAMTRETIGGGSLLYRWPGTDASLPPIGFIAHLDVVPVEPGTEDSWSHPPFSGAIADGAVWGRGSLDNKGQVVAMLEAAERLAKKGFRPKRDIYFLFGDDEEVGGWTGAEEIRKVLDARGVHFAFTIDEGSGVVDGLVPGANAPVALIATAEKGSTTLRLSASAPGGHSSAPGPDTAVSLVARAVVAVERRPYPLKIDADMVAFLHAIAPQMDFARRLALSNLWLTGPAIVGELGKDRTTAAALHTTTAPTMINGGAKVNILPQHAEAFVNYRIHPRDNVAGVKRRAEGLIGDPRISVEAVGGVEPSPRSSTFSEGYFAIAASTEAVFGDIPVAPFLTLQGTDTRHYIGAAEDNYRFTPFIYGDEDLKRIHGTDERVKIEDLARAASWYEELIRRSAG